MEERKDLASLAQEFTLREVDGQMVSLSSLRGQVVILIFCSANERKSIHCSEQIIRFANAHSGDSGVQILSIDPMVHGSEPGLLDELHVYKRVTNQTFPMLLDIEGKVASQFGVQTLPTAVIIDADGHIRYNGPLDDKDSKGQKHYCEEALAGLIPRHRAGAIPTQAFGYRSR